MISLILSGSPVYADTTSVNVSVVWDSAGYPVTQWPDSVSVQLYADSVAYGDPIVLNEGNHWTHTWTDLEKYDSDGNKITYTVDEPDVPDSYTCVILGDQEVGFQVKNTHITVYASVPVTVVWNDDSNQDGLRPDSVSVQLYADGVPSGSAVVLSEANHWSYTWGEMEAYADGERITFTVEETDVPEGYTATVSGDSIAGFAITNTHVPETTSISVEKVWNDVSNQDGLRTDSVSVQLYADGVASGDAVVLSEDNHWAYTWSDLDVYAGGEKITYTVEESGVPDGYTVVVSGDAGSGFTITNTHVPETISTSATCVWDDGGNQDGLRPESVSVQLYADSVASGDAVVLSEDNHWAYTWTNLDVYAGGEEITYTVEETDVPDGYTCAISGDASSGFVVTNTHVPATTSVSVAKVWDDSSNQVGKRPDSVTVQLYADGEASGDAVVLNEENDWTYCWTDLDVYADGEEITYTVEETDVPDGYTSIVSGDSSSGFTITNTLAATPKTGDSMQAAQYAVLLPVSASVFFCIVHRRRKHI
ncbi:MAG: Cna B-type domain-containing protein [Oscillospiraceae bacterium]|jgi:serine-aspartate repeat-containing protein C/D/E